MRFSEIAGYSRPHNSRRFPIVVDIDLPAEKWSDFERKLADQSLVRVLGHDEGPNGLITAHVACTSEMIGRRLMDRWSA